MVTDPYSILGVSRDASEDEIKSAYRKMAKKYHPDLHPDDPKAADRMNEINEAYDMLSHPEKYRRRQAEDAFRRDYSGYSQGYGPYDNRTYRNTSNTGYRGTGGWYSTDFDFEDIFGFNPFNSYSSYRQAGGTGINPSVQSTDSPEIVRVVNAINAGSYRSAIEILVSITNAYRNARWYYLYALALYGGGDNAQATEYMLRATQMEPSNSLYLSLYQKFAAEGRTYYRNTTTVVNPFRAIGRIFLFFIIIRIIALFLSMFFGGGLFFLPMIF